jgi:hypothetical protein
MPSGMAEERERGQPSERIRPSGDLPAGSLRLLLRASSVGLLRPDHLRKCFEPFRRLNTSAGKRCQQATKQAGPVGHDPHSINLNDEAQEI